jgi:hypothetical protein
VRAGLEELAAYALESPSRARGLVVEVHVAGGEALRIRAATLRRLERALERGLAGSGPRQAAPAPTAAFLAGAVDAALGEALSGRGPEDFAAAVPDLSRLIVAAYPGEQAAGEETAAGSTA